MKKQTGAKNPHRTAFVSFTLVFLLLVGGIIAFQKLSPLLSYPRDYEEFVVSSSEKYALDPDLVFAVIRTESAFDKSAVSRSGARGLMQLMPDTAKWIAWKRGAEAGYDAELLFEPAYNIDMGCYLLSYLLEYYGGDLRYALAAYNAGSGNVDRWINEQSCADGKSLEIPFSETRDYVKKILYAYEKYQAKK